MPRANIYLDQGVRARHCSVSHRAAPVLHFAVMPTTRPRYTFTDTGALRDLLDDAQRHWPAEDRKDLLLRLAQAGHETLRLAEIDADAARRRAAQRRALASLRQLVDWDAIGDDQAWR